jgi:large subunit ribosomal protein L9
MAKLILTSEVSGLGAAGDVVEVKDGYARNYLLPRGLATAWTKGGERQVETIRRARAKRELTNVEDAQAAKERLEAAPVVVSAKAGSGGRLFGTVTTEQVAETIAAGGGPLVDKRKIELGQHIKAIGEYVVTVRLHDEVLANVTIQVVPAV